MKKLISFVALAIMTVLAGCTKDTTDTNPYEGTKWLHTFNLNGSDYYYAIEFADTEFEYYQADSKGNFISGKTVGKYTYSGNEIMIDNVKDTASNINRHFTGATVSGDVLTLYYYWVSDVVGTVYEEMDMIKMK